MIVKYVGSENYLDGSNRFELISGDLLEVVELEGNSLLNRPDFVIPEVQELTSVPAEVVAEVVAEIPAEEVTVEQNPVVEMPVEGGVV